MKITTVPFKLPNLYLFVLRINYIPVMLALFYIQSVRSAFYKVDDDHDGILTMNEFRRLLDSFMFIITGKISILSLEEPGKGT